MSMLTTFAAIKKSAAVASPAFTAARARYAALASYETPAALLADIERRASLTQAERDAIVLAMVEENQRAPARIWEALLLAAFEPMLVQLRSRLGARSDADRDQDLLLAFLAALRTVRADRFVALAVRRATAGPLFYSRRKERNAPEILELEEETYAQTTFGAGDDKLQVADVTRIIEARGGSELVEAILATHGTDETLKSYVDRSYENLTAKERASTYDRLKVARRDALARLQVGAARAA